MKALGSRASPRQRLPPLADLPFALAAEFHEVDADAADARLDELALPLFGLAGAILGTAVGRLANVLDSDPGLRRRPDQRPRRCGSTTYSDAPGHPLIVPALAAEVGRRAGRDVHVLLVPSGWYAGPADGERLWLVDATMDCRRADRGACARNCAHGLAFAA